MTYRKSAIVIDRLSQEERLPNTKREMAFVDDYLSFDALVQLGNLTEEEGLKKVLDFRFDLTLQSMFVGVKGGQRSQIEVNERNVFSYVQSPEFTGYFMNSITQIPGLEGLTQIEIRIDTTTNKLSVMIEGAGSMDSTLDPEVPVIETLILDWNVPAEASNPTTPIIGAIMPGVPEGAAEEPAAQQGASEGDSAAEPSA